MTPLLPQLPKGVGRRKLIELLPILFVSNPFFTSLSPFFFFFAVPNYRELHLGRISYASLSITLVLKFPCLQNERRIKKSILVEIMSWNVMDEVVLQSPEGVSAVGPPATRSSCHPSRRAVDLIPLAFLLQ